MLNSHTKQAETMEQLDNSSSSYKEEEIENATKEIIKILYKFEENECNLIMQKIKLHHLELKVASFEVQRLVESALK